jgi:DNA processing protein
VTSACDACLRRAHLVARLAPRIAGLLDRPRRWEPALLALADDDLVAAVAGPEGDVRTQLAGFDPAVARQAVARAGAGAVCVHHDLFPVSLCDLVDAPAALFFVGEPSRLEALRNEPCVAVVGSRRPSPYGLEMARGLGRGLAAAGVTVVSGLALGIDAVAHIGCVEADGFPVAVLAGGPDVPYPRSNRRVYSDVARSGLVLSEMPPGQRAFRWSFPARNRLMAGLAGMTVVVEAAKPSGSLITTEFAEDLGRIVGAVPGRATARMAAGSNALLREGAAVIRGPEDVLDDLLGAGAGEGARADAERRRREALTPELARVLEAVEAGEGVGAIAAVAGLTARAARSALARLEADGFVVRGPLGTYERAADSYSQPR